MTIETIKAYKEVRNLQDKKKAKEVEKDNAASSEDEKTARLAIGDLGKQINTKKKELQASLNISIPN